MVFVKIERRKLSSTRRLFLACRCDNIAHFYALPKLFILASAALALSACGKSDDASEAAAEDTVEMPADELPAMEPSAAAAPMAPVVDASAAADAEANAVRDTANNAAAVAAAAQAAADEGEDPQTPAQ